MQNRLSKKVVSLATRYVYAIILLVLLFSIKTADAASLGFSDVSGNYAKGSEISLDINVLSLEQSINAISGAVNFSPDQLEIISFSKNDSILNYWVEEPVFSNISGTIDFAGIIFNPGFVGENGKILKVKFKVKTDEVSKLDFSNGLVLANDGLGTSIPTTLESKLLNLVKVVTK